MEVGYWRLYTGIGRWKTEERRWIKEIAMRWVPECKSTLGCHSERHTGYLPFKTSFAREESRYGNA
jgi:hypothetical protein